MSPSKIKLEKPVHGSINPTELRSLGLKAEDVLDFSANVNPLGVSPRVREAIANGDFRHYPDPDCLELREALAKSIGVDVNNIMIGNGSTELIHLLARAFSDKTDSAVILAPTFGEYEMACRLSGAEPDIIRARPENGFQWDIQDVCRRIERIKPRLVFFCNPNNPTGIYLEKDVAIYLAEATNPGILVIDEAYLPFIDDRWNSISLLERGNVVLLRSMTKDHALTGLRLGYTITSPDINNLLRTYQPCWSVNTLAQAAGVAALSNEEHVSEAKQLIDEARSYLHTSLTELDLRVLPSGVNFILVEVGDAQRFRSQFLQRSLCVRDCTSFGLPEYIRITVRTMPDSQKLVDGFRDLYSH